MIRLALMWSASPAWAEPDRLPDLPRSASYLIALALVAIWMILRVQILRQRDAHQADVGADPLPAWRWLRWLASRSASVYILTAIALSLLAAAGVLILQQ